MEQKEVRQYSTCVNIDSVNIENFAWWRGGLNRYKFYLPVKPGETQFHHAWLTPTLGEGKRGYGTNSTCYLKISLGGEGAVDVVKNIDVNRRDQ